ncbi:KinB-signaling pathway activation protein [Melghiribacillus thermohalophilus]|uniref:KinB-signaling pathway activation protein n=1 Tax=Melghiribacillus thermohalophilus TaxID=1324956 RepID=UPI00105004B2|nr:KinB-signaling pathway activation protein [Melghiribacillus thermohalophilus]
MTTKKWVRLFFTTLFIGGFVTAVVSFFVKPESYTAYLDPFNMWEIFGAIIWFMAMGFTFSVISQMGFFAYLMLNQLGLAMFRSMWNPIQVFLILFTLFDLVYFRYIGAEGNVSLFPYVITALVIFVYGLAVSYVKAKETSQKAFVPALFFMVVITVIEWVPGLRTNDPDWILLMIAALLASNTYQLLILHRLVKTDEDQAETAKQS